MTYPNYRRRGVADALINHVRDQAEKWICTRIYLTSEPGNTAASRGSAVLTRSTEVCSLLNSFRMVWCCLIR